MFLGVKHKRKYIIHRDFLLARSWSYDKTDEACLLVEHSNMLSLGWNVITRAVRSWWHVNLGTTYLNVPLATVHHLYNVCSCCCSFTSSWIFSFTFTGFIELSLLLSYWCQLQPQSAWILCGLLDGVSCTFLLWYHQPCCGIVHCVPKKWTTKLMVVTLSNLNRFSKFFHC